MFGVRHCLRGQFQAPQRMIIHDGLATDCQILTTQIGRDSGLTET